MTATGSDGCAGSDGLPVRRPLLRRPWALLRRGVSRLVHGVRAARRGPLDPQVGWEAMLLLAVALMLVVVWSREADWEAQFWAELGIRMAVQLPIAAALSLSLRAGVPNLAVGALATASLAVGLPSGPVGVLGYLVGLLLPGLLALLVALALTTGVRLGRAPVWVPSLVVVCALAAWDAARSGPPELTPMYVAILTDGVPGAERFWWVAVVVAVGSVVLGGLARFGRVRDALRSRPRGRLVAAATLLSCLLAAGAGLVAAAALANPARPLGSGVSFLYDDPLGIGPLAEALAAVLLAGTTVRGRGRAVAGTVLAVTFLQLSAMWLKRGPAPGWSFPLLLLLAAVVGLAVGHRFERVRARQAAAPA